VFQDRPIAGPVRLGLEKDGRLAAQHLELVVRHAAQVDRGVLQIDVPARHGALLEVLRGKAFEADLALVYLRPESSGGSMHDAR
jgi:hypothetical protein